MNNKNTIIWVTTIAAIAVLSFFSVGGFLLYNSHIKNKEMEVKLRLEQEKTKQEIARSQSQQQLAQVTTASATLAEIGTKLDMTKERTIELARMYDELHK